MATNQQQAKHGAEGLAAGAADSSPTRLRVELGVEPKDDTCPLTDAGRETRGDVQLVGDRCHVVFEEGAALPEKRVRRSRIGESCPCVAICDAGSAPASLSVRRGSLYVDALVQSREQLNRLSETLDGADASWTLRKLTRTSGPETDSDEDRIALPNDVSVTEKQREIVRAAVEKGYYETPRKTSLGDLAAEFDVSRSALSQRLIAVESKLVKQLASQL